MKVSIKYHGWLIEKLNRQEDTVDIKNYQNGFVNFVFSKLQSLSIEHKKYLNLDFVKVAANGKIIHDHENLEFTANIDLIPPISGG